MTDKKSFKDVFRDRLYIILPVFFLFLSILNVLGFLSRRSALKDLGESYAKSLNSFTNELVNVRRAYTEQVSNIVSSVRSSPVVPDSVENSSDGSSVSSSKSRPAENSSLCLGTVPYFYSTVGGQRVMRYYGRNYSEGSPMSYGKIAMLFPDRVYFDDGSYLQNSYNPDSSSFSSSHIPSPSPSYQPSQMIGVKRK